MHCLAGLLPDPAQLTLEAITIDPETRQVHIIVMATQQSAICPCCGHPSQRVHSRYQRTLADLPWAGLPARLRLYVRRWFCDQTSCSRRIFAEPLPSVVAPRSRRTKRLAQAQQHVGLALGGAAGARLTADLALPAGVDLLLSLVRRAPIVPPSASPHVGIDDWAKRKAHQYGTIIVDLDTHQPIALLDDRSADQVATWLHDHPEVRVVSRDRGQVYIEGATRGAPQALQVADRWHVLKNLGEALLQVLQKHHRTISETIKPRPMTSSASSGATEAVSVSPEQPSQSAQVVSNADQRRQARYQAIHELHKQGWSQRAIAIQLNLERKTVRSYLRMGDAVTPRRRTSRPSCLDPYKPYILERWNAGCHNAMHILRELHAKGFTGQHSIVKAFLCQVRKAQGLPPRSRSMGTGMQATDPTRRAPSLRTLTWLVMKREAKLSDDELQLISQLRSVDADVTIAVTLSQKFVTLVRERRGGELDDWLKEAEESGLCVFHALAGSLKQDLAAVRAGLSERWSQGPVEGQINRLKLLKRQMYGRAHTDLLQQRLLARK